MRVSSFALTIIVSGAIAERDGPAMPCEIDEVRSVNLSVPARKIPFVRDEKVNRTVWITPLVESNGHGGGYYGLNNQREALQNMLLAAYAFGANILLPPSAMLLPFDPRPENLAEADLCEEVSADARFHPPWNFIDLDARITQYGHFWHLWNPKIFKEVAAEDFGVKVTSDPCEGFRHVRVDFIDNGDYARMPQETYDVHFKRVIQAWSTELFREDDESNTVYHLNLGYETFFGSLDPCPDLFTPWLCEATDRALEFSSSIKAAAGNVISALRQMASSQDGTYDVVHYHDMFCRNREYLFHLISERYGENSSRIIYNVGNPPKHTAGLSKRDLDPTGCYERPFQVNAAVEFEVARSARGVLFGSVGSSFDDYLKRYRDPANLETVIIGSRPIFGVNRTEQFGTRQHPCDSEIKSKK